MGLLMAGLALLCLSLALLWQTGKFAVLSPVLRCRWLSEGPRGTNPLLLVSWDMGALGVLVALVGEVRATSQCGRPRWSRSSMCSLWTLSR